jgi:hypothetical protein
VPGGFVRLLHQAAALVGLMTGKPAPIEPKRAAARLSWPAASRAREQRRQPRAKRDNRASSGARLAPDFERGTVALAA